MTLEQLRIFAAVAELQHVTRAAQALHIAQSAASHAIAALEAAYDTKLFNRVGRNIELTSAGRTFLTEARETLARAERAELALQEFAALKRGTLTIHASHTIAGYWLPRHLVSFRTSHPQIELRLSLGNTAEVAQAVEAGAAELGFVEGAVHRDSLETSAVAKDYLVIVVAPEHPWAERTGLAAHDLAESEWVLREDGSGTRSAFEDALRQMGSDTTLRVAMELPSNESVRAAVEAGLGPSALSASVVAPSLEAGTLKRVDFALPPRAFHVLRHRERFLSRAAEALLDSLLRA